MPHFINSNKKYKGLKYRFFAHFLLLLSSGFIFFSLPLWRQAFSATKIPTVKIALGEVSGGEISGGKKSGDNNSDGENSDCKKSSAEMTSHP